MSGGHFDYAQYRIHDIIMQIEEDLKDEGNNYFSKESIKELKNGIKALKVAEVYAQRIDWFLSGDDGDEEFCKRLKEELHNL